MTPVPTHRASAAALLLDRLVARCVDSANLFSAAADCSRDLHLRDAFARLWFERVEFVSQLERIRQLVRGCALHLALPRRDRPGRPAQPVVRPARPVPLPRVLARCARREDAIVAACAQALDRIPWSPDAQRLLRQQAAAALDSLGRIRLWTTVLARRPRSARARVTGTPRASWHRRRSHRSDTSLVPLTQNHVTTS